MKKRTNKYWQNRFELLTKSLFDKSEKYYADLEREYEKAISSIQRDIRDFYGRYGEDITFADTKKLLTPREIREFKDNIGSYIDMEDRQRVSRLHSLQYQIQQQVDMVSAIRLKSLTKLSEKLVKEGYYRSIYEIQKGFGIGDTFTVLDTRTVELIISKPWAPDGSNFSDRIWRDREVLVNELQKELAQSFIRGDAPDTAIRNISKKMEVSKNAAGRLIMTESAFFANESRARAFRELGVEEYQFLATLDMRTSDICQDMDLKIFKLSDREIGVNWPPLHVWCRSTVVPHFEGNIKQRWARDPETGKGYYVDSDMDYKRWYNKYVEPNNSPTGIGEWKKDGNGVVVPTEIITGRYSPKIKGEPNSVIEYTNKSGQTNRNFYDNNGFLVKQIHNGPHNNIKQHPFGKEGEHAHYWRYENGKVVSRESVNIKEDDINSNKDILR